jgi:hypothetical protein
MTSDFQFCAQTGNLGRAVQEQGGYRLVYRELRLVRGSHQVHLVCPLHPFPCCTWTLPLLQARSRFDCQLWSRLTAIVDHTHATVQQDARAGPASRLRLGRHQG